ncbi:hypothetical protein OHT52_07515 [Streptomyces sp. NBC_00247]|uniref:hypothetical protein n=1 Tax=Streptomyces sp. NBC_00247 TaxID=2975689 RepID=UPI002E27FFE1|nr:hypothetical protein [Streptomyces sp. NBC_00247]
MDRDAQGRGVRGAGPGLDAVQRQFAEGEVDQGVHGGGAAYRGHAISRPRGSGTRLRSA